MDMSKDSGGYGLGLPWHYIYGLIILVVVVLLIFELVKRNKNRAQ